MTKYVKLEDIQSFPIRIDHCDHKNGNIHFILGIETVMEYIDYLPQYEFPDAEPIDRPEFAYKDIVQDEYRLSCPFCKYEWEMKKPFSPFCPNCGKDVTNSALKKSYSLKDVCDIAGITAEDLKNAPTPELTYTGMTGWDWDDEES